MLEQRRLQKLGYSTLMVSLPRDWVNQMNLKRGDTVNITSDDQGKLIIHPSLSMLKTKSRCIIHAQKVDEKLLGRLVIGAYIAGHETIEIKTTRNEFSREQMDIIRKTLNELIGVGIVAEEMNRVVVQSFLDPSKFPIDGLISRLNLIVDSMRDLAIKALIEEKQEYAKQVLDMDVEADKVYFLATRQLLQAVEDKGLAQRVGLEDARNIIGDRLVIKALEEAGDYAQVIARGVTKIIELRYFNAEVNDGISAMNETVRKIGSLAVRSLFRKNVASANEAIIEYGRLVEQEDELDAKIDKRLIPALAVATRIKSVVQSIKQIGRYYTIVSEAMINRAVEASTDIAEVIAEE
ncbi:MAG: phosphate uptake regulator PhoU [Nitrososphaerota archaeon]|jgi:phosphate uptake regulator|nr:phosphate uptake regulator PhoU [Nitrososphaerota archaeon]